MRFSSASVADRAVHDDVTARILDRVQSEFLEMPGLRLTSAQAARLWSLDRHIRTDPRQFDNDGVSRQKPTGRVSSRIGGLTCRLMTRRSG